MKVLLAALALALAAATPALAQGQTIFVINYKAGPAWQPGRPLGEQDIGPHAAYMSRLHKEGRLHAAGPTLDVPGGVVLLRAADLGDAKAVMAADPAVTGGLFVGEVCAWRPYYSSGEPLAPKGP